jgi:hypothetical protein
MAYNRYDDWDRKVEAGFVRYKCTYCGNYVDVKQSMLFIFDGNTKLKCSCGRNII